MPIFGKLKVELTSGPAISGRGTWDSDTSGQIWFDFQGKPYPSSIDWKKATSLTFTPDMGKDKSYSASSCEYFFNGGWVGPRIVLQRAHR